MCCPPASHTSVHLAPGGGPSRSADPPPPAASTGPSPLPRPSPRLPTCAGGRVAPAGGGGGPGALLRRPPVAGSGVGRRRPRHHLRHPRQVPLWGACRWCLDAAAAGVCMQLLAAAVARACSATVVCGHMRSCLPFVRLQGRPARGAAGCRADRSGTPHPRALPAHRGGRADCVAAGAGGGRTGGGARSGVARGSTAVLLAQSPERTMAFLGCLFGRRQLDVH